MVKDSQCGHLSHKIRSDFNLDNVLVNFSKQNCINENNYKK